MSSSKTYKKFIVGRNFVKSIGYEQINTGRKRKAKQDPKDCQAMSEQSLALAYQYRQRAKRERLVHLADVNFEDGACVLVTCTFRENVQDYDPAVKAFKLFTKRMRRKLEDVRYIATIEIQQRGAYHFHMLLNLPNVQFGLDNLLVLWDNGIIDIQPVDNVKKAILYITKDLVQQDRSHPLFEKRCYFVSQGLTPCVEVNTWNGTVAEIQEIQQLLSDKSVCKHRNVNGTKAGQTEYTDYYFPTKYYPAPLIAKLRE